MKKVLFLTSIILILVLFAGCSSSKIGVVTGAKTDEQAIKEVVTEYFNAIKNYQWDKYNKNSGLELWTTEGKNDLLNDPKKLPNLEKSIKDNKISHALIDSTISEIKINGTEASVKAVTNEKSTSENIQFAGTVRSEETLILVKQNKTWKISSRSGQIAVIQTN